MNSTIGYIDLSQNYDIILKSHIKFDGIWLGLITSFICYFYTRFLHDFVKLGLFFANSINVLNDLKMAVYRRFNQFYYTFENYEFAHTFVPSLSAKLIMTF